MCVWPGEPMRLEDERGLNWVTRPSPLNPLSIRKGSPVIPLDNPIIV